MLLVSSETSLTLYKVRIVRDIREYTRPVALKADLPAQHSNSAFGSPKYVQLGMYVDSTPL